MFPIAALVAIFATSCTDIYFENPVPQGGEALRSAPTEWLGLYVVEPDAGEEVSELEAIFRTCFRFERTEEGNLLVSTENRLHATDLPRLKKELEAQKQAGKLLDYQLTESFIFCRLKTTEEDHIGVEEQYATLIKSGSWYVLGQTVQPYWLFDFKAGKRIEYERERQAILRAEWLPAADSVSVKSSRLVARQQQKTWYFNTRKEADTTWSLIGLEQDAKGTLRITLSSLNDRKTFEQRMEYYNAITPFRKDGENRYVINPTDEALQQLMKKENLFQTIRMQQLE
ncbi:MAG: hypothetical protein IPM98_21470 [Lewinellaceae bacterium]|nr:hypothetical protein [Lewinellaceae bacterium]